MILLCNEFLRDSGKTFERIGGQALRLIKSMRNKSDWKSDNRQKIPESILSH